MSDIPRARRALEAAEASPPGNEKFLRYCIREARKYLDREKPEFKTARKLPALTDEQKQFCRQLRVEGLPLNEIARKLGTNIGRVSEAVNFKR